MYLGEKEPEMENHHRKWKEIKDHLDNPEILHKVFRKSVMARRRFHADELRALAARTLQRYPNISQEYLLMLAAEPYGQQRQ